MAQESAVMAQDLAAVVQWQERTLALLDKAAFVINQSASSIQTALMGLAERVIDFDEQYGARAEDVRRSFGNELSRHTDYSLDVIKDTYLGLKSSSLEDVAQDMNVPDLSSPEILQNDFERLPPVMHYKPSPYIALGDMGSYPDVKLQKDVTKWCPQIVNALLGGLGEEIAANPELSSKELIVLATAAAGRTLKIDTSPELLQSIRLAL